MAQVNPVRATTSDTEGGGEIKEAAALTTLINEFNGNIDDANIKATAAIASGKLADADKLGLTGGGVTRRGKSIIAGAESTSATTYAIGNLTTPDRVQNVVLPTDGLIVVLYQAIWQNTVASNGRAAIFIGANQLKLGTGVGAPIANDAVGPVQTNDDGVLATYAGNQALSSNDGAGAATEVTTGQVIGPGQVGGPVYVFAAAGTYDVSVQFKNNAAGSLTVKNRHLWCWTIGF